MRYDEALRGFKKACFLAGFLGERHALCTNRRIHQLPPRRAKVVLGVTDKLSSYAIRRLDAALPRRSTRAMETSRRHSDTTQTLICTT